MSSLKPAIGVAALVASLMLPASAVAETVVPPGNSAATQYTEAFPTSGGNAKANSGINGDASPAKVLGSGNAKKLASKGQVGHEVAALAAETAPVQVGGGQSAAKPDGSHRQGSGAKAGHHRNGGSGGSGGGKPGSGGSGGAEASGAEAGAGSSGFGEVLSQATGSGSGQLGLLLPLIVIGTVLWSLNFLWRQRRQVG